MEITWYGHACFRLKNRNATIITDPYDKSLGLSLPRLKADIVTVSHDSPHHNYLHIIKDDFKIIDGPGEYEVKGVFITGIHLIQPKKQHTPLKRNNLFVFYIDDIAICHLGDLSHIPTQSQVEDMGNIDVLLLPVGGQQALNATQAAEVISLIEPYIVIPMHYKLPDLMVDLDPVEKFLKEMGITTPATEASLKLTQSSLPEETQIVLLEPKQ
jgi:L-ascorbate metabolism protein UlaG (beta-lactamase superfamily)